LLNACQTGFRSSCHGFAHLANCREMEHAPGEAQLNLESRAIGRSSIMPLISWNSKATT
jgi:hypothetical protein